MGRIKTAKIKAKAFELMDVFKSEFKDNFEENKNFLKQHTKVNSKKIRNILAGYITRLVKMQDSF